MESEDDEVVCTASEAAERVTTVMWDALKIVDSSPGYPINAGDHHRLCPCRMHVELARIARMLGKKF